VCVCIPYSFYSDTCICDTNDAQLNTSDYIIDSILKMWFWSSSLTKSWDLILEPLMNRCILLVLVCGSLFFLYILLFFNLCDIWCVCMSMYALCKFTLYMRLPYLPPTLSFRLLLLAAACFCRSFASASITLNCEVLGVCQERKGNTSMPFFLLLLLSLFFSLCLICCLVYIEPVRW